MNTELKLFRANVVRNWNFTTPSQTDWTQTGSGWLISGGKASHDSGSPATAGTLTQECLQPLCEYTIRFTLSDYVSGTISVYLGTNLLGTVSANNIYEFTGIAQDQTINFQSDSSFNGSISLVSARLTPLVMDVDLSTNILIPLTYKITDVSDISSRKGNYSKTIVIPGTHNNDIIFNHIYEIDGSGKFNPNKKIGAVVVEDGIPVFEGILKLNKINRINNGTDSYDKVTYDCTLSSSLIDIIGTLKNINLTDLDFSEYDHTLSRYNQVKSWKTSVVKNGVDTPHFTDGAPQTILSCDIHTDGRLKIEFTGAHGFTEGDQIYIEQEQTNLTAPYMLYEGDHKVYSVLSSTEIVVNIPYDAVYGNALTGIVYTHEPIGEGYIYTHLENGDSHASGFGYVWTVEQFTPVLFAREYILKMLKNIGITYTSTFLDSPTFKRLVVPPNGLGFRITAEEIALRTFKAGQNVDDFHTIQMVPDAATPFLYTTHKAFATYDNNTSGSDSTAVNPALPVIYNSVVRFPVKFNDDITPPWSDPNNDYNVSTYEWTCPATGVYDLNVDGILATGTDLPGTAGFIPNTVASPAYDNATLGINIVLTGTVAGGPTSVGGLVGEIANTVNVDFYGSNSNFTNNFTINSSYAGVTLTAGNTYRVYVTLHIDDNGLSGSPFGDPWTPYVLDIPNTTMLGYDYPWMYPFNIQLGMRANATFSTSFTNTTHIEGETISMSSVIPAKVTCADFFKSIISMFNLYITTDPTNEKNLIIETRDDYYNAGDVVEWTEKLDTSQLLELTPMGLLAAKNYEFAYKEDKDLFNVKHVTDGGIIYGNYVKEIDNDFLTNTNSIDLIFSPTVLADFNGSGWVLSTIVGDNVAPPQPHIDANIRILYYSLSSTGAPWVHFSAIDTVWAANRDYNYGDIVFFSGSRYINITGNNTATSPPGDATNWTVGAYVQNDIKYRFVTPYPYIGHLDKVQLPDFDLNWWYPVKVYYTYDTWTDNNLYNAYYSNMIEEVIDKDSKMVTGYFYLKPNDISKLDFRDKFLVDGHYLRLIEISDYAVGNNKPVKCTFIKIENGTRFESSSFILEEGQFIDEMGQTLPDVRPTAKPSILIAGRSNSVAPSSTNGLIEGDDNVIGARTSGITLINSNRNYVPGGISNVTLINTNDLIVSSSNVTYINGIRMNSNFQPISSNITFIDGGKDTVLNPFISMSSINYINAGSNVVFPIGSETLLNKIDSGNDVIL